MAMGGDFFGLERSMTCRIWEASTVPVPPGSVTVGTGVTESAKNQVGDTAVVRYGNISPGVLSGEI